MKKLAIFDIDGTLHKTEVMSWEAYTRVMPALGLAVPQRETLISTYGCNTPEILRRLGVPEKVKDEFLQRIGWEEIIQMRRCGECYEGILPMLHRLHHDGCELALCSMCDQDYMDAFIDHFGLSHMIVMERNETAGSEKKVLLGEILRELRPERAVMVGDRIYDIQAARENNIPAVGCLYGYSPQEARMADAVVKDAAELYQKIQEYLA